MNAFPAISLNGLSLGNDGVGEPARPAEEVDRNPVAVVVRHLRCKQSCKMSNLAKKIVKSAFTPLKVYFCFLFCRYIFKVDDILQLWWQGGRRQTLGKSELLQSSSSSLVAPSFFKAFCRKHRFCLYMHLCLRMISSPYLLLKRAALFSSYSEESIAKKRSLYADNSRSKGCLTCPKQKIWRF